MAYCRSCGKEIEEKVNFCPYCGATTRSYCPPQPVYRPPEPSGDRRALLIIALVVVVVVVLPTVLAGVMYLMVAGLGPYGDDSPTAALIMEGSSVSGINATIVWVEYTTDLDEVSIDYAIDHTVEKSGGSFNVGYGLQSRTNSAQGGTGQVTVTYYDTNGDHRLSAMDRVTITPQNGTLGSGAYSFMLLHQPGGGLIGSVTYFIP